MKYGTILVDPPWPYEQASGHKKLTGYSNFQYEPLSIAELAALPVDEVADNDAVLLLWATWPMLSSALELVEAWGFDFITGLPWVKTTDLEKTIGHGKEDDVGVFYGVGYWFRGCTEPILLAKRPGAKSHRTPWVGLLCDRAAHSRKPDSIYQLAESFPAPRLELFARREREGWHSMGDEIDRRDIREAMDRTA